MWYLYLSEPPFHYLQHRNSHFCQRKRKNKNEEGAKFYPFREMFTISILFHHFVAVKYLMASCSIVQVGFFICPTIIEYTLGHFVPMIWRWRILSNQDTICFYGRTRNYILTAALGIAAGLLTASFLWLPDSTLWDFSYFSSDAYGFWMLTTAIIVLFSEKRYVAAINAGVYVFFLFLITTVFQSLKMFCSSEFTPFETIGELIIGSIGGWLWYSIIPASVCAVLASVFWSAREKTVLGKLLLFVPLVILAVETIWLLISVFAYHTRLFSAITNLVCIIAYCKIIKVFRPR